MIRKWFGLIALVVTALSLMSLSSCARNQHLVSINIQPGDGTFFSVNPSAFFLYKAYGTYIHPPKTVDITSQVTWQTDNPQVAQFTAAGVVSPNLGCGVAQIFATMHDSPNDIVSNQVSITVDGPASQGCPTSGATNSLAVSLTNPSDGRITSSPPGIICGTSGTQTATQCSFAFQSGSTVSLSAVPIGGHNFIGWSGCDVPSGTSCLMTMNGDRVVAASFD
jgi:Divergent InlB B-repeat domain